MIQDPIKTILQAEKIWEEKIELLKKEIQDKLLISSDNLQKELVKIHKDSEEENLKNKENLKSEAKKSYMKEFDKYTNDASKISSINIENQSINIVSDFFNKIAI